MPSRINQHTHVLKISSDVDVYKEYTQCREHAHTHTHTRTYTENIGYINSADEDDRNDVAK